MPNPAPAAAPSLADFKHLLTRFWRVHATSEALCAPLEVEVEVEVEVEDFVIQSMPDVSPPKWHLAHVSWFFEAFLLAPFQRGYRPLEPAYDQLFNSYYQTVTDP